MDLPDHHVYPNLPGMDLDVVREMREQDASAAEAQRNALIAVAFCLALTILAVVGGLPAGVVLFGGTAVALTVAYGVLVLVRRSIRRRFELSSRGR